MEPTVNTRGSLVAISAILMGIAAITAVFALGKGNQQIIAWPLGAWVLLRSWPVAFRGVLVQAQERGGGVRPARSFGAFSIGSTAFTLSLVILGNTMWTDEPMGRREIGRQMRLADNLVSEGRFHEALDVLTPLGIPDGMPLEKARRHHNLGLLLIQLGRSEEADAHLLLAVKENPGDVEALFLLAILAVDRDRRDEAQSLLEMALSIDPRFERARLLRQELDARPADNEYGWRPAN